MSNSEAQRLAAIVRSKDPLEALCKERLITPEACDWVKFAADPFHDMQLDNLKGFPDVSTEPTVVVKIRQAVTVSAPRGLPDGENWNCHLILSPVDYAPPPTNDSGVPNPTGIFQAHVEPHSAGPMSAGEIKQPPLLKPTGRMDGLVINSVPDVAGAGSLTFTPGHCPPPTVAVPGYQMQQINLDDYLDFDVTDLGAYRVLYSGFEVVNTTAQIRKQGAVTVYEYGNTYEMASATVLETAGPPQGTVQLPSTYFRLPPNNLAEAKIMPGSHSWAAQDGCYNIAKFQSDNPFQAITGRNFVFCQNQLLGGPDSGFEQGSPPDPVIDGYGSFPSRGLARTSDQRSLAPTHFSRMNTSGAYFTGLSPESTLFVTWRVGIERLPAANKPTFLALAQPSATFDPTALVLYNQVTNALPPGCPQGYNDAGKWFNWIADNARKAIPKVYPVVRTAAMLAGAAGRPAISGALAGLERVMKPVAQQAAAQRLQAAARRQGARNGNGQSRSGKKPAVQNWAMPSARGSRPGGTNGLG